MKCSKGQCRIRASVGRSVGYQTRLLAAGRGGWLHEVKHEGYWVQVHVRAGRVRPLRVLERYPRIIEEAARLSGQVLKSAPG
jgi:hypothetical protein